MMWILVGCTQPAPETPEAPASDVAVDTVASPEEVATPVCDPRAPSLPVRLTAEPVERVTPLVCGTDLPGATVTWAVDGVAYTGPTATRFTPGDTIFPGHLRAGETWTCTVTLGALSGAATTQVGAVDLATLDPLLTPTMTRTEGVLRYRGTLLGADAVQVRYGFDGWSEREAPAEAVQAEDVDGDTRWGVVADMRFDGDAWTLPLDVPETVRVVQARFMAGAEVDDNAGFEYTWDEVFPAVGPFLTWTDVAKPANGVVVNWESGQPGLGVVEYGPDEENVAYAVGTEVDTMHHVALTGLPPGETWVYRVRDAQGRTSPWASFTTATTSEDSFRFLVASDMQDTGVAGARWAEIATEMVTRFPDARFVVAPGDLTSDNFPGDWWLFFDGGRELFASVPLVPAVGNHDTPNIVSDPDTSVYARWFALPTAMGKEDAYRLDYGRVAIFSLNTEVAEEGQEGGTQYTWMAEELSTVAADPEVDWVLTQAHHPIYNAGLRFGDEGPQYRDISALFDGVVDLDIRAHEHIYQRFDPIRYPLVAAETYGRGEDQGVAYLVTPSAGFASIQVEMLSGEAAGTDQLPHLVWPELTTDQVEVPGLHGYLVGDVTPDTLTVDFYAMGDSEVPTAGVVADTLRIER